MNTIPYPGGKTRQINNIVPFFPKEFSEYREIFVGGGSLALHVIQHYELERVWLNDLHYPVYCFWKMMVEAPDDLIGRLMTLYEKYHDNLNPLFELHRDPQPNEMETAIAFYFQHHLSFSGRGDTYGGPAKTFKPQRIKGLCEVAELLKTVEVKVTNYDYSRCLLSKDTDIFIFADPPYKLDYFLYEEHEDFRHRRFSQKMAECQNKWLITYNDRPNIRKWFAEKNMVPYDVIYTIGSGARKKIGPELILRNYCN